ncbi:MAG: GTPase RsgA, partial [Myxococcales bacterium]|nr:GTPase RsgA [Myxococcales bacterium]
MASLLAVRGPGFPCHTRHRNDSDTFAFSTTTPTRTPMLLRDYGFDAQVAELARTAGVAESDLGRVTADHGIRCIVATDQGEEAAALAGTLRGADRKNERPAVGDWVVLRRESSAAGSLSTIESILPRRSRIARKVAGRQTTDQIVAANVDLALVVVAFGRDVNVSRIERFVAICRDGSVEPLVVITKADLADSAEAERSELASAVPGVTVVAVSALRGDGLESLRSRLQGTVTAVLLGTSGAGKSTLLKMIAGAAEPDAGSVAVGGSVKMGYLAQHSMEVL